MTSPATPQINGQAQFTSAPGGPFDLVGTRLLRSNVTTGAQFGAGQGVVIDANGYYLLADPTQAGIAYLWPGGVGTPLPGVQASQSATQDGQGEGQAWQGTVPGIQQSTIGGDGFTEADVCTPFFWADPNTPGRLPVVAGVDRPFGGLVVEMVHNPNGPTIPRIVTGPIAGLLAYAAHSIANESAATFDYAVDASASTDIASSANPHLLPRRAVRGRILRAEIIPSAALAATSGADALLTFVKVDTTGTVALGSSPTVATFTTNGTALVAGQPTPLTLSGTAANLLLRTTDLIGFYRTHATSGAVIPQSVIRFVMAIS